MDGTGECAEAKSWTESARAHATALRALHDPMEKTFLGIGDRLRKAHRDTRSMAEQAGHLVALLSGSRMTEGLEALDSSVREAQSLRRAGDADDLAELAEAAAALSKPLAGLERMMAEIEILGINARIESAHLDRSSTNFNVFTHEIANLAARGRGLLARLTGGVAGLRSAVGSAVARQGEFRTRQLERFAALVTRLDESARALKDRQTAGRMALSLLPDEVEKTSGAVASLVSDLQGGDITRQRLEHVEAALDEMAATLEGRCGAPDMDADRARMFTEAMCALQIHHVEGIRREFATRLAALGGDLERLEREAVVLGAEVETIYTRHGGGSHFLAAVADDLGAAAAMVARYAEAMDATEGDLRAVVGSANTMAESMRAIHGIDSDMSLLGLNASIKCGNMGERGRSLNVVAQELRGYARRTQALAETVAASIGRIHGVLARLGDSSRRTDGARLRAVEAGIGAARERLADLGGETAGVLAALAERRDGIHGDLSEATSALAFGASFLAALDQVSAGLSSIRDQARPALSGEALRIARAELLDYLKARYTMASERELHTFLVEGKIDSDAPPAPPKADSAAIDDLLF